MQKYDRKEAKKIAKIVKQAPRKKIYGDVRDLILSEKGSVPCTMPARQRPGKTYAGGRALRRAQARLAVAQKGVTNQAGRKMPGAMRP